jgi:alkylation response protein AidB-like acyl-CoA dehydrogenase
MFMSSLADTNYTVDALARDFALRAAEHDQAASFPFENFARLQEAGMLALTVPKSLGGKGAGLAECNAVINRVARGDPSTALVLTQQYLFHMQIFRNANWPEDLREKIAISAVQEGALANMLRVEPELGTPHRGGLPATIARRVAGGWRISGHKIYSTGVPALSWLGIWARTEGDNPLVGCWIVPRQADGIRVEETWNHLGMRASGSHDTFFDDVFVPDNHAVDIRLPTEWAKPDLTTAAWLNTLFTTIYDGVARAARDWLIDFLKHRIPSNLGAPLATLPRMQEAVGAIDALLYANRVLLEDLAMRVDRGEVPSAQDSMFMKLNVTNNAVEAVAKALEVSGNPGLSRDNALQRHHRDVLCARIHSPQNDSILLAGGRTALGL